MLYHSLALDENVQVRDKTSGCSEAVRIGLNCAYGTFTNGGKNFKS